MQCELKHYAEVNLSVYGVLYLKDRKCWSLLLQSCVNTVMKQTDLIFSAYPMYRMLDEHKENDFK